MIEALGVQYSSQKFGYACNTEFDFLRQQAGGQLAASLCQRLNLQTDLTPQ